MAFRIGKNFHIIHMTDDLRELELWYFDVFAVRQFMPSGYMPAEKRDASLFLIGDVCIEPLAPAMRVEGWDQAPLGRFFTRHGKRLHSLAWYVEEGMAELYDRLRAAGFDCRGTAGVRLTSDYVDGPVFTNPRDTLTQLEFIPSPNAPGGPSIMRDPRFEPGWSAFWWADYHPLQLQKLSHVTVSTFDLGKALEVYVDVVGGELLDQGENRALVARSAFVQVGEDLVIELAEPTGEGPLQADMAQFHHGIYSMTYKVRDLDDAQRHLEQKGVTLTRVDDDTLIGDPATTHGVVLSFTTKVIPGDARPDWTEHVDGVLPARLFLGT